MQKKFFIALFAITYCIYLPAPLSAKSYSSTSTLGYQSLSNTSFVGISTSLAVRYPPIERQQAVHKIRELDVRWIREDFNWQILEPQKGTFNWQPFDETVSLCNENKIHILAILGYSSEWASSASPDALGTHEYFPPAIMEDWKNYVTAVVSRYKNSIKHWEIWNEEDSGFWQPQADPLAYTNLLKQSYQTIKKIDPKAQVLLGGIHITSTEFLTQLLHNQGNKYFDILAIHPYAFSSPEKATIAANLQNLKQLVDSFGGDKKIWLTEMGWDTRFSLINQTKQANYLFRFFTLMKTLPFIERVFWYDLRDDVDTGQSQNALLQFGLVEGNFSSKASFHALRTFQQYLSTASFTNHIVHASKPLDLEKNPSTSYLTDITSLLVDEYRFKKKNEETISVFYYQGSAEMFKLPLPADTTHMVTINGKTIEQTIPNHQLTLTLSEEPVIFVWEPTLYQATWISQATGSGPEGIHQIKPGTSTTIEVIFKNTGNKAWEKQGSNKVGLYLYKDLLYSKPLIYNNPTLPLFGKSYFTATNWGPSADGRLLDVQAGFLKQPYVSTGQKGTFTITLTAQSDAEIGIYREDFALAHNTTWMSNLTNGDSLGIAHIWIPIAIVE